MKRFLVLMSALSLLPLCGCGLGGISANYRAIEDLQLVRTLGADAGGGDLVLSAAAGRPQNGAPVILRARAAGLAAGMDALQAQTPRGQLFFAHTQYLVLGQSCAERGVGDILDYVERDVQTRMGAALFVVRDSSAQSLVCGAAADWDVNDVLESVCAETKQHGVSHVFDVRETAVSLSEYGAALVCALRAADTEGSVFALPPGRSAVPDGYGILRDGALIGFLDGAQAQAASLMLGVLGSVTREVLVGDGSVTAELRAAAPEIGVTLGADGALKLDVRVSPEAVIAEADAATVTDDAALAEVSEALSGVLREELSALFDRVRAESADFLALGRALRRCGVDPSVLPADWLQTMEAIVTVETTVRHSYDMGARAGTDGGGRI